MAGQQVVVSVLGDIRDYNKKMAETQDVAAKTFAGVAGAAAGSKMFDALADLGDQALEAMKGYGDQFDALSDQLGGDAAQAFVDGFAAEVVGANIQEAMGIGSELAKTITGTLGYAGDQARAVTEQMTQGVLDIAASTDTAAAEVTTAVTSFLQGKDKALAKTLGLDGDYVRGLVQQKMATDNLTESQARHAVLIEMMGDRAGEAEADAMTLSGTLKEMSDAFEDGATSLAQSLLPTVQSFADFVKGTVVPAVKSLSDWIRDNQGMVVALATVVAVLVGGFQALSAALTIVSTLQALAGVMTTLEVAQKASAAAQGLLNAALTANPIGLVVTAVAALVAGLVWFFTSTEDGKRAWQTFTTALSDLWQRFAGFMGDTWAKITGFFDDAAKAAKKTWDDLVKWFSELPGRILQFFADSGKWLLQAGKDILAGLWKGFEEDLDDIKRGVVGFKDQFVGWIEDAFGIHSPSQLMYDLFGWLAPGAAAAIEDGIDQPLAAMAKLRRQVIGAFTGMDADLALETVRAGGTVNLYRFGDVDVTPSTEREASVLEEFVAMLQRKIRMGG